MLVKGATGLHGWRFVEAGQNWWDYWHVAWCGDVSSEDMCIISLLVVFPALMGDDSWEQAKIDEITDTWHDVVMRLVWIVCIISVLGVFPALMGNDSWEQAKIDEITDTWHDAVMCLASIFYTENEEEKATHRARIPPLLAGLETRLKDNNGGHKYYVGSKVSKFCIIISLHINLYCVHKHVSSLSLHRWAQ